MKTEERAAAFAARERAYAPYSGFRVGAALVTQSGKIYTGCNIENASYSATLCAERAAFAAAISAGERAFSHIVIAGGREQCEFCPPCGVCRQFMSEFCDGSFRIVLVNEKTEERVYTLRELLPMGFDRSNL